MSLFKNRITFITAGALVLAMAPACGGNDCERIYTKMTQCEGGDDAPGKDEFLAACEIAKNMDETKDEFQAMATCSKQDSCEAFKSCVSSAEAEKDAEKVETAVAAKDWKKALKECKYEVEGYKQNERLRAACDKTFSEGIPAIVATADADDALNACRYSEEMLAASETFKTACGQAQAGTLDKQIAEMAKLRDEGKNDYGKCIDAKDSAAQVGGDVEKKVAQLCEEMKLAEGAQKALAEVKSNIQANKTSLPFYCDNTLEGLAKLDNKSDWNKKTTETLLQACFVDLGKVIVTAELPKMKYVCPFRVKQIRDAVANHQLSGKDAALDQLLAKTDARCKN